MRNPLYWVLRCRTIFTAVAGFAAVFALASPNGAAARTTFNVLHPFCAKASCADGSTPEYGLVAGADGIFYGTTPFGGSGDSGVVYALTPNGTGYDYSVLYRFCSVSACADGVTPESPPVVDSSGNLYGTTELGGAHNRGVLFELMPNADRTKWKEVVRYSFCPGASNPCADGQYPSGPLTYPGAETGAPYDGASALYGTTGFGGSGNAGGGAGVVFRISPVAGQTKWKEKVIYDFCSQPNCTDGSAPMGGVIIDARGHLFGTTVNGGNHSPSGLGTVFEINPQRQTETVLYAFCAQTPCVDGLNPEGALVFDAKGRLVGTTQNGGATGQGALFRVNPKTRSEVVLWNFCGAPGCTDGAQPGAGVTVAPNDVLFGTTQYGGAYASSNCDNTSLGCGTLYRLRNSKLTILQSFCKAGLPDCASGAEPPAGTLLRNASGSLFGVTKGGGINGRGTLFELTP